MKNIKILLLLLITLAACENQEFNFGGKKTKTTFYSKIIEDDFKIYTYLPANYTNELFNINRDYESSYNYIAFGAYWKLGYEIKSNLSIQAIGKTDLSRLIDKYEPTIFERPGFMYGIGISYSIK